MKMSPYLMFNGNSDEAFTFYQRVLGGELMRSKVDDIPEVIKDHPGMAGKNMHIRLTIGDVVLMGSDSPPELWGEGTRGVHISLTFADEAEADRVFNGLAEGGTIQMPMEKTFWSARFGMLADRFGIEWMVNGGETI